jgi:hypothetical protein
MGLSMIPQKTDGVPPLVSPKGATIKTNSQATITVPWLNKLASIQSISSYTVILNKLAKPSIVENLNCRRSTCFLPSTLISCLSNLVPWYFSDTVLPCATPIVCPSSLLGNSSEVDMTVSRYGEGGDAEVDGKSKLEVCERV